jgi:hypothetical protein
MIINSVIILKRINKILFIIGLMVVLISLYIYIHPVEIKYIKDVKNTLDNKVHIPCNKKLQQISIEKVNLFSPQSLDRLFNIKTSPMPTSTVRTYVDNDIINYHVEGIIYGTQNAIAIIRDIKNRQSIVVKQGDMIGDYYIIKVTQTSVVLKKGKKVKIIYLK